MDPNAWQAYSQAYSRLNAAGNREDTAGYNPSASLLFAHQQLREAANQHYQNQILPPSLVQAAANNKNHLHQQDRVQDNGGFSQQPPPRQSSQLRSSHANPAFPGFAPPQSPGGLSSYSSQTPSPHYGGVTSPSDYHREREKDERRKVEEERRREQERIRREQERIRQEQEQKRREADRIRKEQEDRKRREEYERRKREEHEKRKREEAERRRREEERARQEHERRRQEQERHREQERIRQEQERIKQERIKQEEMEARKMDDSQRDLGLARLGALTALNDLGTQSDGSTMMYSEEMEQGFQNSFNFNELSMLHQNRQNLIKQEEQKPAFNNYNPWINRANELLDLTSHQQQQANMMSLAPIANAMQQYQQQWLTQYQAAALNINSNSSDQQQQGQQQQQPQQEASYPKNKVICMAADDDMGFLINLPAPCNLLYQPNPSEDEAKSREKKDSPFNISFNKFVKDPDSGNRKDLTEAPDKPPNPYPGQYSSSETPKLEEEELNTVTNTGKKAYIPPYTPKASFNRDDPCGNKQQNSSNQLRHNRTSSGSSGSSSIRSSFNRTSQNGGVSSASRNVSGMANRGSSGGMNHKKRREEEESDEDLPVYRRESSRRKAKEQIKAKRDAQDSLLMDEEDPTLNNPALDLDDSDADDDWTPLKEKDAQGRVGKRGGDSSDDEFMEEYAKAKKLAKKRAYPDPSDMSTNKRMSADNYADGEDECKARVGDFMVLKSEFNNPTAPIWKIDGKTLIQKYECVDDKNYEFKNVNTFSGWTPATRMKYEQVEVKHIRQSAKETIVKRIYVEKTAVNGTSGGEEENSAASGDATATDGGGEGGASNPALDVPEQKNNKVNLEDIKKKSRSETGQFQENFEVYMQTLISQCLDTNFLNEIFQDQDEYFVSNIEKVDSVTLLRKDKLLNKMSLTMGFQHALSVWPCLKDVGAEACTQTMCAGCELQKATTMVQLYGQPYHPNTLSPVQPDPNSMMNRNFSVCGGCVGISMLYHRLHHQKHKLYMDCSVIVETRKANDPAFDTTKILNQLLADDAWLEQQFHVMQELWADADAFQY